MAAAPLSLVCRNCNAPLRSVKEAQDHNASTGHADFEESVEAVLSLVCEDCGKPCRNQTEQDLHTKRTGHRKFVDKTSEAMAIDTEQQMAAASEEIKDELQEIAGPSKPQAVQEKVAPEVDPSLRQQIEDMGFSANKATRALHFTGTASLEQAIDWIMKHQDDADVDEPLMVDAAKPKMSPEETKKQIEDLRIKNKAKREKEEAEMRKLREQERIRSGKELQAAERENKMNELKRNVEYRKREKEQDAIARAKIKARLEEDRRERRRKLGLPEELTAEEQELETKKEEAKKASKAAPARVDASPSAAASFAQNLRKILVDQKKQHPNDDAKLRACWTTLLRCIGNVAQHPGEEKYRQLKLSSAAFQSKVASVNGSLQFLNLCGFKQNEAADALHMDAASMKQDLLTVAGAELNSALTNPFFGML
ncbi:hypothetical protein WJX74_000208 [Apatococcus lobatus]|uniref:UBA domain-containing protein n=1 Tax=Apatococcus lobatus TaxID=904363 RepID=A0AAW1S1F8_9CHLO